MVAEDEVGHNRPEVLGVLERTQPAGAVEGREVGQSRLVEVPEVPIDCDL